MRQPLKSLLLIPALGWIAVAAAAQPEPVEVRFRGSWDAPGRVFITAANRTSDTQALILCYASDQHRKTLVNKALLSPGERRLFVFPVDPLKGVHESSLGRADFQFSAFDPRENMDAETCYLSSISGNYDLYGPGFMAFMPARYRSTGPAIYSPSVDRSFLEGFDQRLETDSFVAARGGAPANLAFDYEYQYNPRRPQPGQRNPFSPSGNEPAPVLDGFVISPDSCPFADDATQLTWLDAIYLDGPAIGAWGPEQKQALETWVAWGGLLFLDPLALNALGGMALARGARADLGRLRTADLAPLRPRPIPAPGSTASGPAAPPGAGQSATPPPPAASSRPSAPVPVTMAALEIRGVGPGGALTSDAPAEYFALGREPALASWSFGAGRVAVQAFQGVGDPRTIMRWLHIQRRLRPANAIPGLLSAGRGLTIDFETEGAPRFTGGGRRQDVWANLGARFRACPTAHGLMIAMAAYVAATLVLFRILRRAGHGSFRRVILIQSVAFTLAAVGVYWAGTRPVTRTQVWEALFAFPDTPWILRPVRLHALAEGACRVSAEMTRDAPLRLVASDYVPSSSDARDDCEPLPLFMPRRPPSRQAIDPRVRMSYGAIQSGHASLVEPNESPGVIVDLRGTSDTLGGTIRNESPFTLVNALALQPRDGDSWMSVVCLPASFPPGSSAEVELATLPPGYGAALRAPRPARALPASRPSYGGYSYGYGYSGASRPAPSGQYNALVHVQGLFRGGAAGGKCFALGPMAYGSFAGALRQTLSGDLESFVVPEWSAIPEGGLVVGWIDPGSPPSLEELFHVTPKPVSVAWRSLYVQFLKPIRQSASQIPRGVYLSIRGTL